MRNDKRLPDAELEVMQTIWSLGTQVTAAEVQQHADKDWKMTSVLTFLSRLCDKGFLSCTKEGRQNLYTPLVSEEDYRQHESVGFLRRLCGGKLCFHLRQLLCGGSVKNLVASLSDAGALTEQDIDELRAFLDRQTH